MDMKKRLMATVLAGFISTSLVGCKTDEKDANITNPYILSHYDNYTQVSLTGDKAEKRYNGSNIVISINKETKEVNEYIYYAGEAKNYLYQGIDNPELLNSLGFIVEIFDLETGELIYFNSDKDTDYNIGSDELCKLMEENDFYNIYDIYEIGVEFKPWYTIEEIREIAQIVINKNTKIKKLTNN